VEQRKAFVEDTTGFFYGAMDWLKGKSKPETIDFPIKHGVFHGFPAIFSLNQSIRFWGSKRGFHHGGSPIAGWCTLWNIHL
jgi:hypothetical protein